MKRLILALAMVVMVSPAWAFETPETVQDFMTACNDQEMGEAMCLGMLTGAGIVLKLNGDPKANTEGRPGFRICADEFVSAAQMKQAFINWAKANPKHWQMAGAYGMIFALTEVWPCP